MRTSIEIHNMIRAEQDAMRAVPQDAENRAEQLYTIQGRIEMLESQLSDTLEEEQRVRDSFTAMGGSLPAPASMSLTEQAFGPRAKFTGLVPGFRAAITIPAAPAVTDPTLPGFVDGPRGFIDTLNSTSTENAVTYLRRGAKTNAAAQWSSGSKAESSYVWTEHTAPLTWIAHHAPISKTQASDWGQLDGIIRGEMMIGLKQRKSVEALVGTNSAGIVGITNTTGIQTYTPRALDNAYDSIRRMATLVRLVSGFIPTHVALSPYVNEALDLLKTTDGQYLRINVGGKVWNLEIVEDDGLTIDESGVTHYGAIVYASVGATWYTKEQDNVEMGLVESQFIQNAYTLLAEGRNAMAVRFPDAFCYCEDIIDSVTESS